MFPFRGPIRSLHHLTFPQGLILLHPGGQAQTPNPPECPTSNSELHFNWWSTQVGKQAINLDLSSIFQIGPVSVFQGFDFYNVFIFGDRRSSGIPGQLHKDW